MARILIVEDDSKLNDGIRLALRNNEDELIQCRNLAQAREAFSTQTVNLVLLDLNLPDGNGMDFLSQIRQLSQIPVIILTANNLETDIVTGLGLGADDYITKPFSLMVLRARVEVQLRKSRSQDNERILLDEFEFDFKKMQFFANGEQIELSKTEQRLLWILLMNKGITLSRNTLIDEVWNGDRDYVDEHALTVSIKRLRDKLGEDPAKPRYIRTVYGIGYVWQVN